MTDFSRLNRDRQLGPTLLIRGVSGCERLIRKHGIKAQREELASQRRQSNSRPTRIESLAEVVLVNLPVTCKIEVIWSLKVLAECLQVEDSRYSICSRLSVDLANQVPGSTFQHDSKWLHRALDFAAAPAHIVDLDPALIPDGVRDVWKKFRRFAFVKPPRCIEMKSLPNPPGPRSQFGR